MEFDFPIPHSFPLKEEDTSINTEQAIQVVQLVGHDCWAFYVETEVGERHVYINSYATRYARGNVNLTTSDKYIPNMPYEMEQFSRDCLFENSKKFIENLRTGYTVHLIFGYNSFEHVTLVRRDTTAFNLSSYTVGSLKPGKISD